MVGLIYRAYVNGKSYIGYTTRKLLARERSHRFRSRNRNVKGDFIYRDKFANALRKHGDEIVFEILYENVPVVLLPSFEAVVIAAYDSVNNGYNTLAYHGEDMAKRGRLPPPVSAETRAKMSASRKARGGWSDEVRAKMSASAKGQVRTAERIEKWKISRANFRHSDASRKKMSKSQLGRKHSEATKEKMRQTALVREAQKRLERISKS